uniref:Uncharacterized protein n=1 Tax=Arundo donax TaxID=35708 RepID=A0A0A8XPH4_ARUDO
MRVTKQAESLKPFTLSSKFRQLEMLHQLRQKPKVLKQGYPRWKDQASSL